MQARSTSRFVGQTLSVDASYLLFTHLVEAEVSCLYRLASYTIRKATTSTRPRLFIGRERQLLPPSKPLTWHENLMFKD